MLSTPSAASNRSSDLLASRDIKHVVVLGANGAMGLGSGALFTTAVPRVTFLARTKEKADGGLARRGQDGALPAPSRTASTPAATTRTSTASSRRPI